MAGATRGWWRDRVAFGDYMLFCFAMRVVLAPSALHTACGCLWENNAPAALHGVAGDTGSPAATTCFFCFAIRVVWRLRRYILLVAAYGKTMRLRRYTRLSGDRVACGDYMLFCFAMRVGLAPSARHTACGCLFVMGRQCAFGATQGWRKTGSPAATTCFLFCHAGGFGAFGATYCLWWDRYSCVAI